MAQSSEKFVKFLQDALTHYLGFPAHAANDRASFSEAGRWLTGARGGGARGASAGMPGSRAVACADCGMRKTLEGSFSAVSKRNFASKYAFESSRRDLHNALFCTALQCQFVV